MDIKLGNTKAYTDFVTAKGEVIGFNAIFKPSTTYNKAGEYLISILVSEEEGKKTLEAIKEVRKEQFKNFKKGKTDTVAEILAVKPYSKVDEETGESAPDSEGRWIIKAKVKANIVEGKATNKIAVFDAKGKPVSSCKLGEGSTVRLKLNLSGYTVAGKSGVSVKLSAVQIINLVEYQGTSNTASFDGFEVEEDGYEFNEADIETSDEGTVTKSSDNNEEDDEWDDDDIPF